MDVGISAYIPPKSNTLSLLIIAYFAYFCFTARHNVYWMSDYGVLLLKSIAKLKCPNL